MLKAAWHMQAGFGLLVVEGVHLPEGASLAPLPEKRRKVACIILYLNALLTTMNVG